MNGNDWRHSRSIPKLLLLMKTNFYFLLDQFQIACQKFAAGKRNCIIIKRGSDHNITDNQIFNIFLDFK